MVLGKSCDGGSIPSFGFLTTLPMHLSILFTDYEGGPALFKLLAHIRHMIASRMGVTKREPLGDVSGT